jgi:acetyl-CoA synthetase
MKELGFKNLKDFHAWSVSHYMDFWQYVVEKLGVVFKQPPAQICDLSKGVESPLWFPHAKMNIAESCFTAPSEQIAIYIKEKGKIKKISFGELNALSNQIANGLIKEGYQCGDKIAIIMPMTEYAVAIYLGVIKMGGAVVSIADSFSPSEMDMRLQIADTALIFTQTTIHRDNKMIPLYEKIVTISGPRSIVIAQQDQISLRKEDKLWENFLSENTHFDAYPCDPMDPINILFSSGTTGEPKAIPWNHTTAIKAASDGFFHQDLTQDDIVSWYTSLGWMMGPWLVFASFINQAAIALYEDSPRARPYGEFIQDAKVTMLGVVPTLVANWRQTHCMEGLNWSSIKKFSSTGECSNAEDMTYLMSLAGNKPIIEYCGGTEIGGAYLTSTLAVPNYPALFSTPAMGLDFLIIDEDGKPSHTGEVAIIPPSIGLSTELINANHHDIYYSNMPKSPNGKILRRHGDSISILENGYFSIQGRMDDTMNLSAIKVSAAEIERALSGMDKIVETAAIAVSPSKGGPSQLIIFAVTKEKLDQDVIKKQMQLRINSQLNPLFKIKDVIFIKELPRTASNKIMRRVLRQQFLQK